MQRALCPCLFSLDSALGAPASVPAPASCGLLVSVPSPCPAPGSLGLTKRLWKGTPLLPTLHGFTGAPVRSLLSLLCFLLIFTPLEPKGLVCLFIHFETESERESEHAQVGQGQRKREETDRERERIPSRLPAERVQFHYREITI